jgi:hypothetical protein
MPLLFALVFFFPSTLTFVGLETRRKNLGKAKCLFSHPSPSDTNTHNAVLNTYLKKDVDCSHLQKSPIFIQDDRRLWPEAVVVVTPK